MKRFLAATLAASLALSLPLQAGGPVLVEDATEDAAPATERRPCIIGCLAAGAIVLVAIVALAGGDDCSCNDQPTDGTGSCGC